MKCTSCSRGLMVFAGWLVINASADVNSKHDNHNLRPMGLQEDTRVFPRIYTATVPTKLYSNSTNNFVSHLDLLDFSVTDGSDANVKFVVQSPRELQHLVELAGGGVTFTPVETSTKLFNGDGTRFLQQDGTVPISSMYSTIDGFPCYRDVSGTEQLMVDLVEQAKSISNLEVTLTDIGDSYLKAQNNNEGYDIWALNITGNGAQQQGLATTKGILMTIMGIHPREYTPPEFGARFAELLVNGYGTDAQVTSILDHAEIHIVIQANPDGRHQEETNRSLRRKNLNGNPLQCGESGFGVDLNRNFPFRWGFESGSSSNPCSQLYRGTSPASEPETSAIVNYAMNIFPQDQRKNDPETEMNVAFPETSKGIFLDIHSFGQVMIWPWSHVNSPTPNDADFRSLVDKHVYFNKYGLSGPNLDFFATSSGVTDEWAYAVLGAAGITLELGTSFYQDCNSFEDNIVPGNLQTMLYAAKVCTAPYVLSKGPDVLSVTLSPSIVSSLENTSTTALTISSIVSDDAYSTFKFSSSQQTISKVQVFIDRHPYDTLDGAMAVGIEMNGSYTSGTETTTLTLSGAQLLEQVSAPLEGRHTIYIQGTDSDGYTGPVSATHFEIAIASPSPSVRPSTTSPSATPTVDSSAKPTSPKPGGASENCTAVSRNCPDPPGESTSSGDDSGGTSTSAPLICPALIASVISVLIYCC